MLSNADLKDRLDFHVNTWNMTCICVCVCVTIPMPCAYICVGGCIVYLCAFLRVQTSGWIRACMGMCLSVSV